MGSTGYKWPSLNVTWAEIPVPHPFEVQCETSLSSARERVDAEPREAAPITVRVRVGIVAEIPYLLGTATLAILRLC